MIPISIYNSVFFEKEFIKIILKSNPKANLYSIPSQVTRRSVLCLSDGVFMLEPKQNQTFSSFLNY